MAASGCVKGEDALHDDCRVRFVTQGIPRLLKINYIINIINNYYSKRSVCMAFSSSIFLPIASHTTSWKLLLQRRLASQALEIETKKG